MSVIWPLKRTRGNSIMFHNCAHTDEPIILCDGDTPRLIVMDSRVFARAYGFQTKGYDMQQVFCDEGMDIFVTATQVRKTENLVTLCETIDKPIVVSKYGWDLVVAMDPAEFEKRQHLF